MFSNVGWGEILVVLVVGLIVIGPERLPGLIHEARAVLLAMRNAVNDARKQLDDDFGEELKEFSKPLQELNSVRHMGAKGFITKTLLEGDDSFLSPLQETKTELQQTAEQVRSAKPNFRDAFKKVPSAPESSSPVSSPSASSVQDSSPSVQATSPSVLSQYVDDDNLV